MDILLSALIGIALAELRLTLEYDKELALTEQRLKLDAERLKAVEETKKKQWVMYMALYNKIARIRLKLLRFQSATRFSHQKNYLDNWFSAEKRVIIILILFCSVQIAARRRSSTVVGIQVIATIRVSRSTGRNIFTHVRRHQTTAHNHRKNQHRAPRQRNLTIISRQQSLRYDWTILNNVIIMFVFNNL